METDSGWARTACTSIKAYLEARDYDAAAKFAFQSAITASERYRVTQALEELCNRAIFYGLCAIVALYENDTTRLIDMYFMSRLTLDFIGFLPIEFDSWYVTHIDELEALLGECRPAINAAGVDSDQQALAFMKDRMSSQSSD